MRDERSARSSRGGRTLSRGLLRTIQQTKVQSNPPLVSSPVTLRIPFIRLCKRNESYASINLRRGSYKSSFSSYLRMKSCLARLEDSRRSQSLPIRGGAKADRHHPQELSRPGDLQHPPRMSQPSRLSSTGFKPDLPAPRVPFAG